MLAVAGWLLALPVAAIGQIYVTNGGVIGEYDATTGAAINASLVSGLSSPYGLAVADGHLYVVNYSAGTIGEYDAATGATINAALVTGLYQGSIQNGSSGSGGTIVVGNGNSGGPTGIAVSGGNLFVEMHDGTLNEYNADTGAPVSIPLFSGVYSYDIAASGDKLYVTNFSTGTIGEYTTSGATVNASLVTGLNGYPEGIAISGNDLFVAGNTNGAPSGSPENISEYDATTGAVINASLVSGLTQSPYAIAVSGGHLFVTNLTNGTVGEYDAVTGATIKASLITGLTFPQGIAAAPPAPATLTWGVNGSGGGGSWDSSSVDWYNGSSNTTWNSGDVAAFAGSGGFVTIGAGGQNANGLIFNATGYTVSGFPLVPSSDFTVQTNFDATLNATLNLPGSFTKSGNSILTLGGTFLQSSSGGTATIAAGKLNILSPDAVNSSTVYNFSNVAGAGLVLNAGVGSVYSIGGLYGGGSAGGNVTVGSAAGTSVLTLAGLSNYSTYGGSLQDNGAGQLALNITFGTQTLTGTNTYSGATQISGGSLKLSGDGSILNSSIINSGGVFSIDNSAGNNTNRVSDTDAFIMTGGTFLFQGSASGTSTETVGTLTLNGGESIIEVTKGGSGTAVVTFTGVARDAGQGTVDCFGTGSTQFPGMTNTNGILGAYAVYNSAEWAALDAQKNVIPYAGYVTNLNTAAVTDNVKLSGSGMIALTTSGMINSLNIQNGPGILDLGGNILNLSSGGLLITNVASATTVQNGSLTSSGGEIIVSDLPILLPNTETINANIIDSPGSVSLTKSGSGNLYLGGVNTYSGATTIDQGALVINSPAALPATTLVNISGGTLTLKTSAILAGLAGNGSVSVATGALTVNTPGSDAYSGLINGAGGLVKSGSGTLALTAANGYTGTTQISGGTLLLHEGEILGGVPVLAATPVILSGGTLALDTPVVGGIMQRFGALTLQADSTISFVNSPHLTLAFANSSSATWGSNRLKIINYNASATPIRFGTTASGLTPSQLGNITFVGLAGKASLDANGNLVMQTSQTFSQWQTFYGVSGDPTATPENDGVSDLFKFLYDIDPTRPMTVTDRTALPILGQASNGQYLTLTYHQNQIMTGAAVVVQTSTDLQTWQPAANPVITKTGIDPNTGDPIMQVQVAASGARQFLRLSITNP